MKKVLMDNEKEGVSSQIFYGIMYFESILRILRIALQ